MRLGFGAIFAAQPAGDTAFYLVVAFEGRGAIAHEHAREVESVDHLFKLVKLCAHVRFVVVTRVFARASIERRGDPTIQDEVEGAAFGARLGGEVANELAVGGKPLALASLQAPLGGEVGVGHYKAFAHGMRADGLQQEALAGAVASNQEPEACAAIGNEGKIG